MKKINFVLLFLLLLASVENTRANDMISESNENFKNSWLYNFNPELISKIEIKEKKEIKTKVLVGSQYLDGTETKQYGKILYNGIERDIDDYSKECYNIKLIQKNKENLIKQLPNGCNISFVDENKNYESLIYLCSNKGCEKKDIPFECIENDIEDCGF